MDLKTRHIEVGCRILRLFVLQVVGDVPDASIVLEWKTHRCRYDCIRRNVPVRMS